MGAGLDEHRFRNRIFQKASLAAFCRVEDFGNAGGQAKDVGGVRALGSDESGNSQVTFFEFFLLGETVLQGVPFFFQVAFREGGGETGDPDEREYGNPEENQPGKVRDDQSADQPQTELGFFGKGFTGDSRCQIDDLWHQLYLRRGLRCVNLPREI